MYVNFCSGRINKGLDLGLRTYGLGLRGPDLDLGLRTYGLGLRGPDLGMV